MRRRLIAGVLSTGAAVGAMAVPAAATHTEPDPRGSCVSWFVANVPPGHRGEVISFGAHTLQPFGRDIVSAQARSPRGNCIHFPV